MAVAKIGDNVSVKYSGKLSDGTIFDETESDSPFVFNIGSDEVIPGFENGIIGMEIGEKKVINIPVDDAYGAYSEELVFQIDKDEVDAEADLQIGDVLEMPMKDGNSIYANVVEISDDEITIDANHELAGEDLTFEVELLSIN